MEVLRAIAVEERKTRLSDFAALVAGSADVQLGDRTGRDRSVLERRAPGACRCDRIEAMFAAQLESYCSMRSSGVGCCAAIQSASRGRRSHSRCSAHLLAGHCRVTAKRSRA